MQENRYLSSKIENAVVKYFDRYFETQYKTFTRPRASSVQSATLFRLLLAEQAALHTNKIKGKTTTKIDQAGLLFRVSDSECGRKVPAASLVYQCSGTSPQVWHQRQDSHAFGRPDYRQVGHYPGTWIPQEIDQVSRALDSKSTLHISSPLPTLFYNPLMLRARGFNSSPISLAPLAKRSWCFRARLFTNWFPKSSASTPKRFRSHPRLLPLSSLASFWAPALLHKLVGEEEAWYRDPKTISSFQTAPRAHFLFLHVPFTQVSLLPLHLGFFT